MQPLSPREREVLAFVTQGATSKEIGHRLGISARTVEAHRASILAKSGARNTVDLVHRMLENGRAEQALKSPALGRTKEKGRQGTATAYTT